MGWFFRKSINFGPLRVNLSKSGVGISAGVRGARISTGPRGAYLNVGRGGVFYRQKIGGSSRASGPAHTARHIPQSIVEQMPTYPEFPRHGLPRIVKTLLVIGGLALLVGIQLLAVYHGLFISPSSGKPGNQSSGVVTPPVSYRALQAYSKDGHLLKNILIPSKLEKDKLIQLAKYLHSTDPSTPFRIFDDDSQFQKFMEWDVNYPNKSYSYPKAWADKHYLADVSQKVNLATRKTQWQLTDQKGNQIAPLE